MNLKTDFIHLNSGYLVNPVAITHIDFRKPAIMIHVGNATIITENADDAAMLREFEPTPDEKAAATAARANKKAAAAADAKVKASADKKAAAEAAK